MVPQNDSKTLKRFKNHLIMLVRPRPCSRVSNVSEYFRKHNFGMTLKKGTSHETIIDLGKTAIPKNVMEAMFLEYVINRRWLCKRFEYTTQKKSRTNFSKRHNSVVEQPNYLKFVWYM